MLKQIICTALAAFFVLCIKAQSFGEIHGKIVDAKGKPVPGAIVSATNGVDLIGDATDSLGKFRIKPLKPGQYEITATSMGMETVRMTEVLVNPDKITFTTSIEMNEVSVETGEVRVIHYKVPLIRKDGDHIQTLTAEDLEHMSVANGGKLSKIVESMSADIKPATRRSHMS